MTTTTKKPPYVQTTTKTTKPPYIQTTTTDLGDYDGHDPTK